MLITSTTDSQETIDAILAPPAAEEVKDAPKEETKENSAASEEENSEAETESESETDEEAEQEEEAETAAPKKQGGFQKKIDKLSRRIGERDGRIAFLEAQLAGKPAGTAAEEKPAKAAAAEPAGKPVLESFETYEAYTEALTDWKIEQRESARQSQQAAKAQADEWTTRVAAAKERIPDFLEVVGAAEDVPISAAMDELIRGSEHGPELVYALVKNPAEARRIAALSPLHAARELGKFEAKLKPASEPEPKPKTSAAPAPIKPVGTKATKSQKNPSDMSMKEYNAWRDNGGGR